MSKARARDTWISEPGFVHYFTDEAGEDHNIVNTIAELRCAKNLIRLVDCPVVGCFDGGIPHQISEDEFELEDSSK